MSYEPYLLCSHDAHLMKTNYAHHHDFFSRADAAMSPSEVPIEEIAQAIDTTIQQVAEPVKVQTGPIWLGIHQPSCSVRTTKQQDQPPVLLHLLALLVLSR